MPITTLTETVVEDAILAWLESLGRTIVHGQESPLALLPKLVSGEVRVTDVGQHISEEYT